MKVATILYLFIAAMLLPGLVAQGTSAIFSDTEQSVSNSLTAGTWVEEVAKFLVADDGNNIDYVYMYDSSGAYADRFELVPENNRPQGVASVGAEVYVLDHVPDRVYHYSISEGGYGQLLGVSRELREANGGNLLNPSGMAIYGDDMWIVEQGGGGSIFRYSVSEAFVYSDEPLNGVQEIPLASGNTNAEGLAIDASYLYVADTANDKFYRYERSGGGVATASRLLLQVNGKGVKKPAGALYDGTSLWTVDQQLQQVLEYDVNDLFSGDGSLNATSQFNLHSENTKADGL